MRRLTEAWFEFNGIRSSDRHVIMMDIPKRPIPAEQGDKMEIDGRSGFLWKSRKQAKRPIVISVQCSTADGWTPDELTGWLQGAGMLRFSDEPDRAYKARVSEEFSRESMFFGFDRQVFTVPFDCQPFRYFYPEPAAEVLTGAKVVTNPGTAHSQPRITIEGSGDMVVNIGEYTIETSGAGIIVDSEEMNCYELNGVTLANQRVIMDEYPVIPAGGAVVSWAGGVTRVTIEGRWRSA